MMFRRCVSLALLVAFLGLLPACMKVRVAVHVNPDASGKLHVAVGLKEEMKSLGDLMEQFGEMDEEMAEMEEMAALFAPEKLMEEVEGIVAWSETRKYEEGGFSYFELTGYFEDVNDLKIQFGDETSEGMGFRFEKRPDGSYELGLEGMNWGEAFENGGGFDEQFDSEAEARMAKAMMGLVMQDFEVVYEYHLPGEVTEAQGLEVDGRSAKLKIDGAFLMKVISGSQEAPLEIGDTILCKPEGDLAAEMAAFRNEMAEAKARSGEKKEPAKVGWY